MLKFDESDDQNRRVGKGAERAVPTLFSENGVKRRARFEA